MPDNTPISPAQPGGDTIATDEVTTLNGAASSGVKVQRVKLGWGVDGTHVDASAGNPLPVVLPGTQAVSGPLTNAELRAVAVPVSGTFWQPTQPVSLASLPPLPAGSNAIGSVNISNFPASQTVSGAVSVSNFPATQAVSVEALPLPSGAATDAGQATGNASLANIDGDLGAQADAAASSDTGAFSLIALVKRALQNWTTLLSRTPLLGQAAMAASQPVVIASDQTPVPTAPTPTTASGTITTQNLVPNGAATANSAVEIVLNGATSLAIQATGVYTGALSLQVTLDGSRWETVTGSILTNMLTGVAAATIASAAVGVFTAPVHGALRARVTGLAAMTGTAAITLRTIAAPTALYALQPTAANLNATVAGTVTANIGTGALAAGTNAIGDVGLQVRANATGAGTPFNYASPATSAGTQVKTTAGRILAIALTNTAAAVRFVKFFNVNAAPTMGTTAAAYEYAIPAGGSLVLSIPQGNAHTTGIFIAVTTAAGLTNNTSTSAANDVVGFLTFA